MVKNLFSASETARRISRYRYVLEISALVRPRTPFVLREVAHRTGIFTYRLRGEKGQQFAFRHAGLDSYTVDEVFGQQIYSPPAAVSAALAALRDPLSVLDLGANIGLFAVYACSRFRVGCLTAFEPDPANRRVLDATASANAADWDIHEAAAAAEDGRADFYADGTQNATLAETKSGQPIEVATEDVLPLIAKHDLVKIDIEGGEWALLTDPRFADVSPTAIALEFHPELCPHEDARATATEILIGAGYRIEEVATQAPPGYGSLWAWRPH